MKSAPSWPGSSGRHGSCSSFHSLLFSLGLFTVCLDKMNTHVYCCYTWIFARALVPHMLSFGWLESNVNRHYNCRLMFQDICGLFRKAVLHFLYRLSFSDLTAPVGKTFFFWCNQELVHPLIMRWDDCSHLKSVFTLAQTELESPADRGRAEQSPNIWDNCDGANDETSEISSNCNCSFFFFFFLLRWNLSSSSVWTCLCLEQMESTASACSEFLTSLLTKRFNRFFSKLDLLLSDFFGVAWLFSGKLLHHRVVDEISG